MNVAIACIVFVLIDSAKLFRIGDKPYKSNTNFDKLKQSSFT